MLLNNLISTWGMHLSTLYDVTIKESLPRIYRRLYGTFSVNWYVVAVLSLAMTGQTWCLDQKTTHVKDPHLPQPKKYDPNHDWVARLLASWYREDWAVREGVKSSHATFYITPFVSKYRTWKYDNEKP